MLEVFQNADFVRSWRYRTLEDEPVAMTTATCEFVVMDSLYDGNVELIYVDTDPEFTITNAEGLFELTIPAEDFDLPAGDYVMRMKVVIDGKSLCFEAQHLKVRVG